MNPERRAQMIVPSAPRGHQLIRDKLLRPQQISQPTSSSSRMAVSRPSVVTNRTSRFGPIQDRSVAKKPIYPDKYRPPASDAFIAATFGYPSRWRPPARRAHRATTFGYPSRWRPPVRRAHTAETAVHNPPSNYQTAAATTHTSSSIDRTAELVVLSSPSNHHIPVSKTSLSTSKPNSGQPSQAASTPDPLVADERSNSKSFESLGSHDSTAAAAAHTPHSNEQDATHKTVLCTATSNGDQTCRVTPAPEHFATDPPIDQNNDHAAAGDLYNAPSNDENIINEPPLSTSIPVSAATANTNQTSWFTPAPESLTTNAPIIRDRFKTSTWHEHASTLAARSPSNDENPANGIPVSTTAPVSMATLNASQTSRFTPAREPFAAYPQIIRDRFKNPTLHEHRPDVIARLSSNDQAAVKQAQFSLPPPNLTKPPLCEPALDPGSYSKPIDWDRLRTLTWQDNTAAAAASSAPADDQTAPIGAGFFSNGQHGGPTASAFWDWDGDASLLIVAAKAQPRTSHVDGKHATSGPLVPPTSSPIQSTSSPFPPVTSSFQSAASHFQSTSTCFQPVTSPLQSTSPSVRFIPKTEVQKSSKEISHQRRLSLFRQSREDAKVAAGAPSRNPRPDTHTDVEMTDLIEETQSDQGADFEDMTAETPKSAEARLRGEALQKQKEEWSKGWKDGARLDDEAWEEQKEDWRAGWRDKKLREEWEMGPEWRKP
ncbi:MAG: hypothetical protein M1831_001033 [Alyxoria varia]|nr:MAG: hypothetical protein M1831_001033 [Alyxoria varia]